ncbi:MAG TPA: alpha/beta hydrolase [Abditibacteriaceae bacterium]|jgi:pimeloyl-ACP methyl ester carboxylesterase
MDSQRVRGGWGDKRRYARTALRVLTQSAPVVIASRPPRNGNEGTTHHCIVLHGWGLDATGVDQITGVLQDLPACATRRFWDVTYDSQWTSFEDNAAAIVAELAHGPHRFEDVILVGYSMGGLIARRMVALGFPCRAMLTLCTPHAGPVPWLPLRFLPFGGAGPRSLMPGSAALQRLNADARDREHRARYHLFAITYSDLLGAHAHDGIVPLHSALGEELGPVASRHTQHLNYRGVATYDPHWRGKTRMCLKPVADAMAAIETEK